MSISKIFGVPEEHWREAWLRGENISEVAWIGQDALAWCSSLQIVFFDIPSNKLRLLHLSRDTVHAGASCISGHLRRRIFAYAEKNAKPRIFVYQYPSMKKLCECDKGTKYSYIATTFCGDFLVSLSSIPDFELTVWLWRTGDKLTSVNTAIHDAQDYGQSLRTNFSSTFIAQTGTCGRLITWEMTVANTTVILTDYEIRLPAKALVKDVAWCPESSDVLAICDRDGHIYLTDPCGNEIKRIVLSQRCGVCIDIEPAAICWYRGGIILRTTFCQIRYYHTDFNNIWRKFWFTKHETHPWVLTSYPFRNDRLFFITQEGHIVKLNVSEKLDEAEPELKHFIGAKYRYVDFIQPWGDYIVAMDESMELSIINAYVGGEITSLKIEEIEGNVTYIISHPNYPLVVACTDKGEVIFISLLYYYEPKILGMFKMHKEALDLMKFSCSGRYLVVCEKQSGICFFFTINDEYPSMITKLESHLSIIDILLFDTNGSLKFYLLHGTSIMISIGYKLLFYDLPYGQREFKSPKFVITFANYFEHLHYVPGKTDMFVGTPYLSKQLSFFKINNWKDINCVDVTMNGHKIRQVNIHTNETSIITSSLFGSIIVKNMNLNNKMYFLTHHSYDLGVTKAIVNSKNDLLIALGYNGSLVALKDYELDNVHEPDNMFKMFVEFNIVNEEECENKINTYLSDLDQKIIDFLTRPINDSFTQTEEWKDITWVEWKQQQKIEEEKKRTAEDKEKLVSKFTTLKNKVINLLNKNQTSSEFKILPTAAFDLDKVSREKKMKSAKDKREEVQHELKSNCHEMDRVSNYIKTQYWDPQNVLAQSVFGIYDDTEVTNYTICVEKLKLFVEAIYEFVQFKTNVFKELMYQDNIYPWDTYDPEYLETKYEKNVRVKKSEETERIEKLIEFEEEPVVDPEEELNRYLLEGMTTHHFIDASNSYNSQFKIYAYAQVLSDNRNIKEECMKLRYFFNTKFNEMYSIKEREMNLVRERIDRIKYIDFELYSMFEEHVPKSFDYPEWKLKEKPENIITVTDDEMLTRVYISPSQQELLNRKAEEEERARQAMLADDFRERALQAMMDGVLEVRWEDLIKRDPPKPECMLVKEPDDYTDDDILVVKRYEELLKNLEADRMKYKKILQTDYTKISGTLKDNIEKFNSRLEEFHLFKMKVEAAIQQLDLRYVRYLIRHVLRIVDLTDDEILKKKIEIEYQKIARYAEEVTKVHEIDLELRNQYESLSAKDKLIDKRLINEFPKLGKNAFTAVTIQFKRRPRQVLKTTSAYEVMDLATSIVSMSPLPYLTVECADYLKHLEMLEVRPANLPQSVENHHWKNLVAFRRIKIDHEIRLHALSLQIDAVTNVLADYARKQAKSREAIESMKKKLIRSRRNRIECELDAELQLVLKMGQVEIHDMKGDVHQDSIRAILVPKSTIDMVNEAVVKQGKRKMRMINLSVEFMKGIVVQEWEHECLSTKLKHLGVELYYLKVTNVTRSIKEYLKRSGKGLREDKTTQRMQKEFDVIRQKQEKLLKDWETKVDDVNQEILRVDRKNKKLDEKIVNMNVDRCDMELKRDLEGEARQKDFKRKIFELLLERSTVIRKLLKNYEKLLGMKQELEKDCVSGTLLRSKSEMLQIE